MQQLVAAMRLIQQRESELPMPRPLMTAKGWRPLSLAARKGLEFYWCLFMLPGRVWSGETMPFAVVCACLLLPAVSSRYDKHPTNQKLEIRPLGIQLHPNLVRARILIALGDFVRASAPVPSF